ncbi:helix-turn-helix domain-containing protein [Mitsuokella jalaludinii]|uniref:helix-turn-helix domain-containing protein n=1 Tax=Mitsuokella jalaludinii TaxID=187979 RepID=UPI002675A95A|nr:helix-turn-helix transcriptional regulator [uncultured Mitsuokella sp.]
MKREVLVSYRGHRSQEEMGKLYNVSQQVWSRWENGTAKPRVEIMKQLEEDIGVPMETIFFDVFNTSKALNTNASKTA